MVAVTVVGTGAMGAPVARNLLAAGHEVAIWNRDPARAEPLVEQGAARVPDLREVFARGVVLSALADDAAVRAVFLDSEALPAAPAGAVHVNLATISPSLAREAAAVHADHGVGYVAAPMFGRVAVAEAARLNIVTAGQPDDIARVEPLLNAIAARTWPLGDDPARANTVKLAGNLLIASAIQSLAEAVSLAERGGVEADRLIEILTSTILPGPVYTSYGDLIARAQYEPAGFTVPLGRKDIDLARAHAADHDLRLPTADLLSTLLTETIAAGRSHQDWSSLAALQRDRTL